MDLKTAETLLVLGVFLIWADRFLALIVVLEQAKKRVLADPAPVQPQLAVRTLQLFVREFTSLAIGLALVSFMLVCIPQLPQFQTQSSDAVTSGLSSGLLGICAVVASMLGSVMAWIVEKVE